MGRPRAFDEAAALDAAMRVFWRKSYEGASLSDLTRAMRINRSSMYAAFGDKEALFRRAIARYSAGPMKYIREALAQPTVRGTVTALVNQTAEFLAMPGNPRGCLSVQGALACGTEAEPVRQALIEWRKNGEAALTKRFERARKEGDLSAGVDPPDFARYVSTVMSGLAVQAANGASKSELRRLATMALRFMPF
jgi:AcrR family transcriptional regulator